jgi:hypothetical protein
MCITLPKVKSSSSRYIYRYIVEYNIRPLPMHFSTVQHGDKRGALQGTFKLRSASATDSTAYRSAGTSSSEQGWVFISLSRVSYVWM